jgi:hypothetical protein
MSSASAMVSGTCVDGISGSIASGPKPSARSHQSARSAGNSRPATRATSSTASGMAGGPICAAVAGAESPSQSTMRAHDSSTGATSRF